MDIATRSDVDNHVTFRVTVSISNIMTEVRTLHRFRSARLIHCPRFAGSSPSSALISEMDPHSYPEPFGVMRLRCAVHQIGESERVAVANVRLLIAIAGATSLSHDPLLWMICGHREILRPC